MAGKSGGRDLLGSLLGIAVFLGGVALLLFVFQQAREMFAVPPQGALGLERGKAVDPAAAGDKLIGLLLKVLLLVIMGVLGSLIANRGISMYFASRALRGREKKAQREPDPQP